MKKLILLFLSLLSITISQSQIEIFNDGVLEYTSINFSTSVSVTKYNNVCPTGALIIPEIVMYNSKEYTITSIEVDAFKSCTSISSVSIPSSVTNIGEAAFASCTGLISVSIPDSVTSIEVDTFLSCSALTSFNISNNITSIGERAFAFCSGLTSINIPDSVMSISEAAFLSCTGLTSVTVNWITPLVINENVFQLVSIENLPLNVPPGTKSAYQTTLLWKDFGSILNTSDFNTIKLQVYPNPVKNQFTIQLKNNNQLEKINIYNNLGQLIKQSKVLTTDVKGLNSGLYFLEVETNQGKLYQKIIKE